MCAGSTIQQIVDSIKGRLKLVAKHRTFEGGDAAAATRARVSRSPSVRIEARWSRH